MLSNLEEIGKRIKSKREELGMKQQVLAFKTKIDIASISRYENAKQEPSLESFVRIAQALNVSTDYLIFGGDHDRLLVSDSKKAEMWSEVVCYALATLIETNTISIRDEDFCSGISLNLDKNQQLLLFFDKFMKLGELRGSFDDEQYESAKQKIVSEFSQKIYDDNINLFRWNEENRTADIFYYQEKCDEILQLILSNHKKITMK